MSSPRAAILFTLLLAALAIGLVIHRLSGIQEEAIAEAERAIASGKTVEAIAAYRRALRSDFPLSSRTAPAASALLALGDEAREAGDEELAKLAYRSLVGGWNASKLSRSIEEAAYEEALSHLGGRQRGAESESALGARPFAIFIASLGLGLALFYGFRMLLPSDEADKPLRRAMLNAALFGSGLALFIAGLLSA